MNFQISSKYSDIYPNQVQEIFGKKTFIFRDHRWILPLIYIAGDSQILRLPANIVSFDRHPDFLDTKRISGRPLNLDDLINKVSSELSPRDDDWVKGGMELGLIGDVIHFCSDAEEESGLKGESIYTDFNGLKHVVYHLGFLSDELVYGGALSGNKSAAYGLWNILGWEPEKQSINPEVPFILDIDLDFFSFSWRNFTIPFNEEIFLGEFKKGCQSEHYDDFTPGDFFTSLIEKCAFISIATEPKYCGGHLKAEKIFKEMNVFLFNELIDTETLKVDYQPCYPDE